MMIEIYLTSYFGLGLEDLPSCLGLGLKDLPTTLVSDWRTFLSEQTCLMFCPPGLPLSTASYKLENLEKTTNGDPASTTTTARCGGIFGGGLLGC